MIYFLSKPDVSSAISSISSCPVIDQYVDLVFSENGIVNCVDNVCTLSTDSTNPNYTLPILFQFANVGTLVFEPNGTAKILLTHNCNKYDLKFRDNSNDTEFTVLASSSSFIGIANYPITFTVTKIS